MLSKLLGISDEEMHVLIEKHREELLASGPLYARPAPGSPKPRNSGAESERVTQFSEASLIDQQVFDPRELPGMNFHGVFRIPAHVVAVILASRIKRWGANLSGRATSWEHFAPLILAADQSGGMAYQLTEQQVLMVTMLSETALGQLLEMQTSPACRSSGPSPGEI